MIGRRFFPLGGHVIFKEGYTPEDEQKSKKKSANRKIIWTKPLFSGSMLIFQGVTRWWFRNFLKFSPLFGVDSQFAEHIFHMGWFNHQLGNHRCFFLFSEKFRGNRWPEFLEFQEIEKSIRIPESGASVNGREYVSDCSFFLGVHEQMEMIQKWRFGVDDHLFFCTWADDVLGNLRCFQKAS